MKINKILIFVIFTIIIVSAISISLFFYFNPILEKDVAENVDKVNRWEKSCIFVGENCPNLNFSVQDEMVIKSIEFLRAVENIDPKYCYYARSEDCILQLALLKKNLTLCNNLTDSPIVGDSYSNYCRDVINATSSNDSYICDRMINDSFRRNCYRDMALFLNNSSFCGMLSGDWKNICYVKLAIRESNSELCKLVGGYVYSNSTRDRCITVVSANVSGCKSDIDPFCLYYAAISENNISLCESFGIPFYKILCKLSFHYSISRRTLSFFI